MHIAHSNAHVGANGDITGDTNLSKLFGDKEPVKVHPGQPIATQDNIKVPVAMAELLVEVDEIEQQYLKTIHARFCIPRALEINLSRDISRYYLDKVKDPNYYEYWYKFGTPQQMFLMSRRLSINPDGTPVFDVRYNVKLERGNENDQQTTR